MSTTTAPQSAALRAHRGLHITQIGLSVLGVVAMAAMMWVALIYAKPAANLQGVEQTAQRIFYIHMGCNFAALSAFLVSLIASIGYLITRNLDWDRLVQASIEIGLVFGLGTTITGAIWAKPTWNTYWTWDPRLTTVTITVLIYVAYLLFRNGIDNRQTRARFGSIYALFAFLSLPLTYYSARWFRSIHPVVFGAENAETQVASAEVAVRLGNVTAEASLRVGGANATADAQGGFGVGSTMITSIEVAAITFVLLFSSLLILRFRQLRLQDRLEEIREDLE